MTEREFWQFLEKSWEEKGRASQVSSVVDNPDLELKSHGQYISGHAFLPNGYDKISEEEVVKMGKLLFDRHANSRTKEAIMVILAHIPSKAALNILKKYSTMPNRGLEIFAQIALDECEMWNE